MITSFSTLLPIEIADADAVDIGITIKPIPVGLKVTEFDVVAKITNVSNDFSNLVIVLYFLYFFFDYLFLSSKYVIISLMFLIQLLKLLTSFNFFSNICSRSKFSKNGAVGYKLSVFWSIYIVKDTLIFVIIPTIHTLI